MAQKSPSTDKTISDATILSGNKWWLIILLDIVIIGGVYIFALLNSFLGFPLALGKFSLFTAGMVASFPFAIFVAVAVHFDRKYVTSVSEWNPKGMYYLIGLFAAVGVGIVLGIAYLYNRHRFVGVP